MKEEATLGPTGWLQALKDAAYDFASRRRADNALFRSLFDSAVGRNERRAMERALEQHFQAAGIRVEPADVILDLGANVGTVSEIFLRKGCVVHAYEPQPFCIDVLKQRLGSKPNFFLHEAAVSDRPGTLELYRHRDFDQSPVRWSKGVTVVERKAEYVPGGERLLVQALGIDDVLAPHERIKVLKLNIEGGEYAIYSGILRHIAKIDLVLMSSHPKIPGSEDVHRQMLADIKASGAEHKFRKWWG